MSRGYQKIKTMLQKIEEMMKEGMSHREIRLIIHQIRNTTCFVSDKDIKKLMADLKLGSADFACIEGVKVQVAFFSFKAHFHTGKRTF